MRAVCGFRVQGFWGFEFRASSLGLGVRDFGGNEVRA